MEESQPKRAAEASELMQEDQIAEIDEVKKARGPRKMKTTIAEDYMLQVNLDTSPHIKNMSQQWQKLYAAMSAAAKKK
ncbi:hypothetical protein [Paenibacillus radicis (ex Xue et al. 2023)]|uniref:Uncharacterized protein n=1 Tax=Paenibacillus radicis (ex Xue et al. 2023) TaxID=2972489 RepID=A0ABT1YS12_9BACL|nr:hypothetical protein [Paenibacillus radicis (ex Xue et al. 2023)]MCR8635966.1 hypothetical protein [Paenibacillus radicis (ex Xue et al. 2023)]